ncbi:MAG: enoyl-ACP reductase [Candidatus Tectomicrobia bacterium]|uniref:Enoyl-[acyl-carrier-protein] reductase [NADH] n=1 Tax=Tectimicrobiota bacterium TaxID=2528274 RepID=A0A937W5T6_UNCTE|nr:enoyl-ACP reductase [Candidatus Tectomicrobia bacterium]
MDYVNLQGKTALVLGIANRWSIAYAIAQLLHEHGVRLAVTYQNERIGAEVRKLTSDWPNVLYLLCELTEDEQIDTVFAQIQAEFGQLNHLVHCIAFAEREDLQGEFRKISRRGFHTAMDISAYSLVAVAQRAAPLMPPEHSSVLTLTYMASERVVPNYNVMALAKAALENSVRYLANDLGPHGIRVNAISAGPVKTASARAISGFTDMLKQHADRAPLRRNITVEEVGKTALYLCSDLASGVTGTVQFVDAGYHILGL